MTATITQTFEFSEDNVQEVELSAYIVPLTPFKHRGEERFWLESIRWNNELYSNEENLIIEIFAYSSEGLYDRFIKNMKIQ